MDGVRRKFWKLWIRIRICAWFFERRGDAAHVWTCLSIERLELLLEDQDLTLETGFGIEMRWVGALGSGTGWMRFRIRGCH